MYIIEHYLLDEIKLDHAGEILEKSPIRIGILRCLAHYALTSFGDEVPIDELKRAGWPNAKHVSESTVNQHLYLLRDLLGEDLIPRGIRRLNCRPTLKTLEPQAEAPKPVERSTRTLALVVALVTGVACALAAEVPARTLLVGPGDGTGSVKALFNHVAGVLIWTTFTGISICAVWRFAVAGPPSAGSLQLAAGATGGALGGVVVGIASADTYVRAILQSAGVALAGSAASLADTISLAVYPILGLAAGAGVASLIISLTPWWRSPQFPSSSGTQGAAVELLRRVGRASWLLALYLALAGAISYNMLDSKVRQVAAPAAAIKVKADNTTESAYSSPEVRQDRQAAAARVELERLMGPLDDQLRRNLVGEGVGLYLGGIGLSYGLFLGLIAARKGITIRLD